ncbi:hypothetical protein DNTS_023042 [Danionella cerebrum]|nr:hypothetical protein DNTS_023042 [Danionella translucida]
MVEAVAESIHFPSEEEKILEFWNQNQCFQQSLKQSKSRPRFSFYDGPPFATGLPHYGHILAGTIKDIVTRFAHQNGFYVERRFGWDCHGLPVVLAFSRSQTSADDPRFSGSTSPITRALIEYEIDKALNIKGPEDVAKMGIEEYNRQCRGIVMRYANEWESSVRRMGRWIDFSNDYKTLYPWFMETVWWVFKQLFDKGLVYRGVKVMPFSTACNTPLSNFEAHQNYKDVQDPSVIVTFPLLEDESVSFLAWTTTPWTLPSNLALCVNPELVYVKVRDNSSEKIYILMEARLVALFKSEAEYTILERFPGKTLKGKKYKPLFDYFLKCRESGAFSVVVDGYVRDDDGTGVVHQAPYFGADDFRVCMEYNIIQRDSEPVCPVDSSGFFTSEVTDFAGQYVKEADKLIIKCLKEKERLVNSSTFKHSYPFCWRSDTPLIYKAVPSWFVRVEHMVEKLLENNSKCYWVPEFVREKRFGNWLRDARDWAVSRNRYWGTPIPLWVSEDFQEVGGSVEGWVEGTSASVRRFSSLFPLLQVVCVGSMSELEELTGTKVTDLHRESIDSLTIPSRCGKAPLRRVSEVFDCWFESGSMPYAQVHYPFENRREFEDAFPADFIAEGIDQTRGWFYTLLVLSTALFGKPPFKNVIVNGLRRAEDEQAQEELPRPLPDRAELWRRRSPEEGVRDVLKDVFLPWFNAYRFLVQNVQRLQKEEKVEFLYDERTVAPSVNIMDQWIQSFTQSLVQFFRDEMGAYRLYTVVPRLVKFVDMLTNWYVRMNRRRLKGESGSEDCVRALETLFSVLFSMCRLMVSNGGAVQQRASSGDAFFSGACVCACVQAPFTPFITELMYQNLRHLLEPSSLEQESQSIHYLMLPHVREALIDQRIENAVSQMQSVIELGRVIRDRKTLPIKYPLKEVVVIHQDPEALTEIQSLQTYILEVRSASISFSPAGGAFLQEILARRGTQDPLPSIMILRKGLISRGPGEGGDLLCEEHTLGFFGFGCHLSFEHELNVRTLTLSTDKDRYGIRLRAEPDHMVLGKRLKAAFKSVTASIKELKSQELESFQRTGVMVVDGHELHEEDLRLLYTFEQSSGAASRYEAHSDAQVLVLLDVTPDQTMVDEGVAREVINRIQKLRKKETVARRWRLQLCDWSMCFERICAGEMIADLVSVSSSLLRSHGFSGARVSSPRSLSGCSLQLQLLWRIVVSSVLFRALDSSLSGGLKEPTAAGEMFTEKQSPEKAPEHIFHNKPLVALGKSSHSQSSSEPRPEALSEAHPIFCRSYSQLNRPLVVFQGHLVPSDEITVYYDSRPAGAYLQGVIEAHTDFILATIKAPLVPCPLKGSDLELTIVRGAAGGSGSALDAPACAYVNLRVDIKDRQQEGVVLLENPRGDNRLDLEQLKRVCCSVFGLNGPPLSIFHGSTALSSSTDLMSLSGKTLTVASGLRPSVSSSSESLLCPFVNLQLVNGRAAECQSGDLATLLLMNPQGKNLLRFEDLLLETQRVFGLRGRRLSLYTDLQLAHELKPSPLDLLDRKMLYVKLLPTTAQLVHARLHVPSGACIRYRLRDRALRSSKRIRLPGEPGGTSAFRSPEALFTECLKPKTSRNEPQLMLLAALSSCEELWTSSEVHVPLDHAIFSPPEWQTTNSEEHGDEQLLRWCSLTFMGTEELLLDAVASGGNPVSPDVAEKVRTSRGDLQMEKSPEKKLRFPHCLLLISDLSLGISEIYLQLLWVNQKLLDPSPVGADEPSEL